MHLGPLRKRLLHLGPEHNNLLRSSLNKNSLNATSGALASSPDPDAKPLDPDRIICMHKKRKTFGPGPDCMRI